MAAQIKGKTLGKQEISELFGVAESTVDQWIRRGCPIIKRGSKGVAWEINSAAVSDWLRQRDLEQATGNNLNDEQELKRRKLAAETQKAEMEMLKAKGELVPLRQLERALANTFAELKTNMRNIPRRTATSIVGETDEIRIKEVLLAEVDQALEVLSQFTLDEPEADDDD